MDDAQLVQRAADGDEDAFALVYSRYATRVYDFLWWVLQDREQAAQALYETFLEAGARIHQLRDPAKLRPWLFAVASRQALGRQHHEQERGATEATLATAPPPPGGPDDSSWNELVQAVRSVAGELSPQDRALLDLRFRQGLQGEELGDALGVAAAEADARVDRLTERTERSLSLTAVACLAQKDCVQLRALLPGWDRTLDANEREIVEQHARTCAICAPRRQRHIRAAALLGVSPALAVPVGVREHVIADVELASHRGRPWSARRDGFPRSAMAGPDHRWRIVAAATAAVVVLVAGGMVATRDDDGPEEVAAVGTTTSAPRQPTTVRPSTSSSSSSTSTSTSTPPGGGTESAGSGGATPGTTAPSSTGTGSGSGSGSSGGGSAGGGGGGGGGSTSPEPDPTPPETDPPTTTTTAAPDTTGPALSGLSVSPSVVRAGSGCTNSDPAHATVSIQAADPSGIARVVVTVAGPGGGSTTMPSSGGGTYSATVGPFESPLPPGNDFPGQVVVQATDGAGNSAAATASLTLRCSA